MASAEKAISRSPVGKFILVLRAFKHTMRLNNCLMGILIVVIGAVAALRGDVWDHLHEVAPAALVAFFLMAGGNMINDVSDAVIDRKAHPGRAIPRGIFSRRFVLAWAVSFYGGALLFAGLIDPLCLLFALGAEVLLVLYELFLKRYPGVGNLVIGALVGCVFLGTAAAIGRWRILGFLAVLGTLINIAREMIKDVEDMEGDADRMTLPKKIGKKATLRAAGAVLGLNCIISVLPYYPLGYFSGYSYPVLIVATNLVVIYSISISGKKTERSQHLLKFAMLVALMAFLFGSWV